MGGYNKTPRTPNPGAFRSQLMEGLDRITSSSVMDGQSDLEVILEFLEEYYRQTTSENVDKCDPASERPDQTYNRQWTEPSSVRPAPQLFLPHDTRPASHQNTTASVSDYGSVPNFASTRQSAKHKATATGSGRKVRLFHFLFEMLEDPSMAHCLSWVPASAGVFRFSSRNKDQVAALWGQKKGNKRPMTYQKMSRALRNYARSGEIFKVKKKLTYQFSYDTLMSLQMRYYRDQ